jgi:hypothetical protein
MNDKEPITDEQTFDCVKCGSDIRYTAPELLRNCCDSTLNLADALDLIKSLRKKVSELESEGHGCLDCLDVIAKYAESIDKQEGKLAEAEAKIAERQSRVVAGNEDFLAVLTRLAAAEAKIAKVHNLPVYDMMVSGLQIEADVVKKLELDAALADTEETK